MGNDGLKALFAGGVVLGGALLLLRKGGGGVMQPPLPPQPGTEPEGGLSIEIFDPATGLPVPQNSPATLVEGKTYIARVTVTNRSARAGAPIGASLWISLDGGPAPYFFTFVGSAQYWEALYAFGPGETKYWDVSFTVPVGAGGLSGKLNAYVTDSGKATLLASAFADVDVQTDITYAVDLTIGV